MGVIQPGMVSFALCWASESVALMFPRGPPRCLEGGVRTVTLEITLLIQQTRKLSFREDKGTVITFAATLGPSQDQKCTDTLTARSLCYLKCEVFPLGLIIESTL